MKTYDQLDERIIKFIKAQKMFFVATAPLSGEGHVNLSPKGYDSLVVLDEKRVAWLDIGGSGVETVAHLKENGRITIMYCAFEGPANILRLFGKGRAVTFDQEEFPALLAKFEGYDKARAIIVIELDRIQDSCGWGVPFYEFKGDRDQLDRYANREDRNAKDWAEKYYTKNGESIDGLPAMERPS